MSTPDTVHVLPAAHGLLVSPLNLPGLCSLFERMIPHYLWRPLYQHQAILIDASLREIGDWLPRMLSVPRCETCWQGIPCSSWMASARAEALRLNVRSNYTPEMDVHVLDLYDCMRRPCILVLDESKQWSRRIDTTLRHRHRYHYDDEVKAWYFNPNPAARRLIDSLGIACGQCRSGVACPAWNAGVLISEMYTFERPRTRRKQLGLDAAATRLGLTLPVTEQAVQQAFRARALHAHPDQGGTQEQIIALLEAREMLLKQLG